MSRYSFGKSAGRTRRRVTPSGTPAADPDQVVRELKGSLRKPRGEDYRDRSLAIHGMVCAKCGREFGQKDRHLLTVHHKDGNHHNNPPDGSNWENLCVYCHDDEHSRGVHAEYVDGDGAADERPLAFTDPAGPEAGGGLGDLLKAALEKKGRSG